MKHQNEDILEDTLRGLKREAPSPDFHFKVLHQVRTETSILRKRKDYLLVIPKILLFGIAMVLIIFFYLLSGHIHSIELQLENQLISVLTVTLLSLLVWLCFIGTDWMVKKMAT
jgi:hypothetical protein